LSEVRRIERKGFVILKSGNCDRNPLRSPALVAVNSLVLCVYCERRYVAYVLALLGERQLLNIQPFTEIFNLANVELALRSHLELHNARS
jgi:hypothetical protein